MDKVRDAYKFPNNMVAVFNAEGEPMPELQGEYSTELHQSILDASDENTELHGF